jgi:phosphate transport system substrate-binding protein
VTRVLLVVTLSALVGCRQEPAQETLLIAGASAVKSYLEPVVEEFSKRYPRISIVSESGGNAGALLALKKNAIDIAGLSRMLDAEEDEPSIKDYQITSDAVAVVASPANPIRGLTLEQVRLIFEGKAKSWKALGGLDVPIKVYRRKASSRSHRSFADMVLDGDEPFLGASTIPSADELTAAMQADASAIGYMSMNHLSSLRPLDIDGIALTRVTALSGRYPLSRAFYLVTAASPTPATRTFVDFVLGPDGQRLLREAGLLPVR